MGNEQSHAGAVAPGGRSRRRRNNLKPPPPSSLKPPPTAAHPHQEQPRSIGTKTTDNDHSHLNLYDEEDVDEHHHMANLHNFSKPSKAQLRRARSSGSGGSGSGLIDSVASWGGGGGSAAGSTHSRRSNSRHSHSSSPRKVPPPPPPTGPSSQSPTGMIGRSSHSSRSAPSPATAPLKRQSSGGEYSNGNPRHHHQELHRVSSLSMNQRQDNGATSAAAPAARIESIRHKEDGQYQFYQQQQQVSSPNAARRKIRPQHLQQQHNETSAMSRTPHIVGGYTEFDEVSEITDCFSQYANDVVKIPNRPSGRTGDGSTGKNNDRSLYPVVMEEEGDFKMALSSQPPTATLKTASIHSGSASTSSSQKKPAAVCHPADTNETYKVVHDYSLPAPTLVETSPLPPSPRLPRPRTASVSTTGSNRVSEPQLTPVNEDVQYHDKQEERKEEEGIIADELGGREEGGGIDVIKNVDLFDAQNRNFNVALAMESDDDGVDKNDVALMEAIMASQKEYASQKHSEIAKSSVHSFASGTGPSRQRSHSMINLRHRLFQALVHVMRDPQHCL